MLRYINGIDVNDYSFHGILLLQDQITDWFDSLAECLHSNVRKKQKTLDELSDLSSDPYEETKNET